MFVNSLTDNHFSALMERLGKEGVVMISLGKPKKVKSALLSEQEAGDLLALFYDIRTMKDLPRSGWFYKGIKNPESLADHSWSVSMIALSLGQYLIETKNMAIDLAKITYMAIIHDLPELKTMDIPTPIVTKYLGKTHKHEIETSAFLDVFHKISLAAISVTLLPVWQEFDAKQTVEAKLVNCADKLDMMLQAIRYEELGHQNMSDFWEDGKRIFTELDLLVFYDALRALQKEKTRR